MHASSTSLNNITEGTEQQEVDYNNYGNNAIANYHSPMNDPHPVHAPLQQPLVNDIVPFKDITITDNDGKGGSKKQQLNKPRKTHPVSQMCFTDPFGDAGMYTGEVDEESCPHGKGKMRYDNGIFYEGNWVHGKKNDSQGASDQMNNATRERILSGFTSWKGQKSQKNLKDGTGDQGTYVYGMEWVDHAGMSGKYTGHVDHKETPDGRGIMRYEFGLIAEGEWIKGVLNDGQGMGAMGAATVAAGGGMTVAGGGMTVAPGAGMSVAGGAQTVVSGMGMMSVCGGGAGMMGAGFPRVGHQGMGYMMAQPHFGMNAMQPTPSVAPMSYYNPIGNSGMMMAGAGSVAPSQYGMMMHQPQAQAAVPTGVGGMMNQQGMMNSVPTNIAAPAEQQR